MPRKKQVVRLGARRTTSGAQRVDPQTIQVLKDLPRKHRQFLFGKFASDIRKTWNSQRKYERLAELLGSQQSQQYNNLYLHDNGSLFAWYKYDDPTPRMDANAIYNALTKAHPGIGSGLFPKLGDDVPAQLHRVINYGAYIAIEYASQDATRSFVRNWKEQTVHVDKIHRVVVRNNPFTVEVRAPGEARRKGMLAHLGAEIKADLLNGTFCNLGPSVKYDALDAALKARFSESTMRCSADGLSGMNLRATETERMDASTEWLKQMDLDGRDETHREYEYETVHPDGYPEQSFYTIVLATGEMRVSPSASERAIENLRQHVIDLF